jgi:hypothetical protein
MNLYFVSLPFGETSSKPIRASSDWTLEILLMGTLALTETSSFDASYTTGNIYGAGGGDGQP